MCPAESRTMTGTITRLTLAPNVAAPRFAAGCVCGQEFCAAATLKASRVSDRIELTLRRIERRRISRPERFPPQRERRDWFSLGFAMWSEGQTDLPPSLRVEKVPTANGRSHPSGGAFLQCCPLHRCYGSLPSPRSQTKMGQMLNRSSNCREPRAVGSFRSFVHRQEAVGSFSDKSGISAYSHKDGILTS
jgi:hypothetical protein